MGTSEELRDSEEYSGMKFDAQAPPSTTDWKVQLVQDVTDKSVNRDVRSSLFSSSSLSQAVTSFPFHPLLRRLQGNQRSKDGAFMDSSRAPTSQCQGDFVCNHKTD
ncbi:unnamed protein product [Pleuronectes platessa]|uniref:Uncharacterized protein n=1 Tax=Pleuronectes platessa TaxID=8262 RepID=A0A9N7VNU9_PLEPL|nr:unnamed protein product [Pleuronectes platessa]